MASKYRERYKAAVQKTKEIAIGDGCLADAYDAENLVLGNALLACESVSHNPHTDRLGWDEISLRFGDGSTWIMQRYKIKPGDYVIRQPN